MRWLLAGSIKVRNAADFVGRVREFSALPQLQTALLRTDIAAEAKVAIVRGVGFMAHPDGNAILTVALRDASAPVRAAAAIARVMTTRAPPNGAHLIWCTCRTDPTGRDSPDRLG